MVSLEHAEVEKQQQSNWRATAGVIVTRVLFPLWLLSGALFKLSDLSPANLPVVLVKGLGGLGLDLNFVLRFSISVELIVVCVIVILPRLARLVTILILVLFMPILVGDFFLGAATCGCFGSIQLHPLVTFAIDGVLLVDVLFLGREAPSLRLERQLPLGRTLLAGTAIVACFALSFGIDAFKTESEAGDSPDAVAANQIGPSEGYYLPDYSHWVGSPWFDLDIANWVQGAPEDLGFGMQYILFYRLDCEHCHELMEVFFSGPLDIPATAIAVPERAGFPTEGVLPMACGECRRAELPAEFDWFFNTPVLLRLEEGVVICAQEASVEDPGCFSW